MNTWLAFAALNIAAAFLIWPHWLAVLNFAAAAFWIYVAGRIDQYDRENRMK